MTTALDPDPAPTPAPDPATALERSSFGSRFTWGVAHASYQVEGYPTADGKGPSIWDTFSATRGKVRHGDTGDVACEHYRRYPEDLDIVRDLGFDAQRFSISWPRVIPTGVGPTNQAGLDHYSRVVDACLERGLQPWVTLYHWDLPQALQDLGGWANRDVVEWFAHYVHTVVEHLGDRVEHWMVFNEPSVFTTLGYLLGVHAPGLRRPDRFLAAVHHVNLAQAAGARAARAATPTAQVGTSHSISPFRVDGTGPRAERAQRAGEALGTGMFLEPNLGLGYPVEDAPILRRIERHIRPGDDRDIVVDWDFVGVQYYQPARVRPAPIPGFRSLPANMKDHRRAEITATGWEVHPDGIYDALEVVHRHRRVPRLIVTENGAAMPDQLVDGRVHDHRRLRYYQDHLTHVRRAITDGMPVEGYFCWSLLDNFEWAEGYEPRFGIVRVDYDTQLRTLKDTAIWFRTFLEQTP